MENLTKYTRHVSGWTLIEADDAGRSLWDDNTADLLGWLNGSAMYYPSARSLWDDNVNQSPADYLRECTITELSRETFEAIAADYVRAYDSELRSAGHNDETLEDLQWAIATVLGRESWLGTVADDAAID